MFKQVFLKAGLSPTQAEILEYLYNKKKDKASNIAKNLKKSRAMIYKDLEEMIIDNLIEKIEKINKVTNFRVSHPSNLEKFFNKKEKELQQEKALFQNYLPDMISNYNLINNKPGIKYYEGKEGIEIVAKDSLNTKTEIYSYVDTETILKAIPDFTNFYIKERIKKNITKKIIEPDSEFIRKYLTENNEADFNKNALTQTKLLDNANFNLHTVVQIYDNKVSYINFSGKNIISMIIEDENISFFHKQIFEYNWEKAKILKYLIYKSI